MPEIFGPCPSQYVQINCGPVAHKCLIHRGIVIGHPVMHGTNESQTVDQCGATWQILANNPTGDRGSNRLVFTTNLTRRVRFHVSGVDVTGTTVEH